MVTAGILVRTAPDSIQEVEARLAALQGVSTLELEEPGAIGLVIEGDSLDAIHATLCDEVQGTEGVLAAWPVHTQLEATETGSPDPGLPNTGQSNSTSATEHQPKD